MPIVPRVNPAPLPGVRLGAGGASDAAFGGGSGNAIAGLQPGLSAVQGEALRIRQEEKEKADQVNVTKAVSDLSSQRNQLLFGPDGALTKQGSDAFTTPESMHTGYFASAQQIRGGLTSDEQRDTFDRYMANDWRQVDEQVQSHVAAQRKAYDTNTTDALVANMQNQAIQGYADPATVETAIGAQRGAIEGFAKRSGWSDEQTKEAISKQVSATHVGVISQMLNAEQDITAAKYFAAHKDEVAGADQARVTKALDAGSTLGEAQRAVDKIVASKVPATDALAKAEAIDSPKVRDEAIKLLTSHLNNVDRAERLDREDARARVLKDLEGNNGRLNRGSTDWQLIDGHAEGEHVLARQQQMLHPPPDHGDPDKYLSYVAMGATSPATRQALLSTNIADIVGDATLNSGQKTAIINMIRSERGKDLTDLRRRFNGAHQEAKRLETIVTKARNDGDDDAVEANSGQMYAAQQKATLLRGQLLTAERAGRANGASTDDATDDTTGEQPAAPGAPAATAPPADHRTSSNPLGLAPVELKPLTPEMHNDLAAYGERYADYLRTMGYAVPTVLPKRQP